VKAKKQLTKMVNQTSTLDIHMDETEEEEEMEIDSKRCNPKRL